MVLLTIKTKLMDYVDNQWHHRPDSDLYTEHCYINPDKVAFINKCKGVEDTYQITIECGSTQQYIYTNEKGKRLIETWKATPRIH